MTSPEQIIEFWFSETKPEQWFSKDPAFDALVRDRFLETHARAARCELFQWRETAPGRLAEVIVLDQFSRNLYRDDPRAFSSDPLALALAQEAIHAKDDLKLTTPQKSFLYMPFMHSESLAMHDIALRLFDEPGMENNLKFEKLHRDIIEKYGRYPHRNGILGRASTPEEIEFLKTEGSSF